MSTADREISARRLLDAPCELVFDVWTDPQHVAVWWGPNGFTNTVHEMDVRAGGNWRFTMHGPDGIDYPNEVHYIEVKRPERMVYTHGAGANDPDAFRVTVTFEAVGNKTMLAFQILFNTAEQRNQVVDKFGAVEGLNQNLDRFESFLRKGRLANMAEAQRIS
ncbi:MAG: SRPBCC family protein [Leptospirales bacterium]|nr:SRPBCC family protein [Leptospirales bacterium]